MSMLETMKAALFDLDGVIVDTAKYHFQAWKRLADGLGIPFDEADNERLKGVSRMRSLDIILELGDQTVPEAEKIRLAEAKNARTILDRLGIADRFDVMVDGTMVSAAKPDPEVFLLGARELGVPLPFCVVFEDARSGIEAAKRAGMGAVGIGDRAILDNADLVVGDLAKLAAAEVAHAGRS